MPEKNDSPKDKRVYIPLLITVVAFVMLVVGIWSGEPREVWQKAVSICLSCIGIG